jgi:hypothetical protein
MFTSNYISFRKVMFLGLDANSSAKLKAGNGTSFSTCAYWSNKSMNGRADIGYHMKNGRCKELSASTYTNWNNAEYDAGMYFGSGTTPASKSDYKLESPITTGLTIVGSSVDLITNDSTGEYTFSCNKMITNTTENNINISEIGLFTPVDGDSNSVKLYMTLMERTVLDTPIIIPPGETKVLTYKLTFNQPQ